MSTPPRKPFCAYWMNEGHCRKHYTDERCEHAHPQFCHTFANTNACLNNECPYIHIKMYERACAECGVVTKRFDYCPPCWAKKRTSEE